MANEKNGKTTKAEKDLKKAIQLGVRKINVGSVLKRSFFEAMRSASSRITEPYNPYEVVGAGLGKDVLACGRIAMQEKVEELMRVFGSAGRA